MDRWGGSDKIRGATYSMAFTLDADILEFVYNARFSNDIDLLVARKVDDGLQVHCCGECGTEDVVFRGLDSKLLELLHIVGPRQGAVVCHEH